MQNNKSKDKSKQPSIIKRKAIKQIMMLMSNLSPANLIRMVSIGEKLLIRNKSRANEASGIKKAIKNNPAATKLILDTLSSLSKNCKEKFIENFFINAAILGSQKSMKVGKKIGFGLPWFFVISPTAKCNLKCVGCYAFEYQKNSLPFEVVDRVLNEAKELGIHFITISGGEPFIWPHLFKILEKHNDMFFQIYTNGTLINEQVAKRLSELGNAAPAISVEGFEKKTDERRGKGTFQKIMKAMDNLKKHGVLFGFSATCTSKSSDVLVSDEFIDFFVKKGCKFGWYFQYIPIGRKPALNLMSSVAQRGHLRERVSEIRNTKPIFIGDFWNDGPYVHGCLAGARPGGYFHINCNGDVEPIREAAPYCDNKNLLTPCALIDNPQVARDTVKKYGAKPSYSGGEDFVEDPKVTKFLDDYSKEYHKITDPIWEKEFAGHSKHWKDR